MEKAYNPKDYEDSIYKQWEESGLFNPDNLPGDRTEPFAVMFPPPNVTGVLHLGHALENTFMDTQVRFERMRGKKALLVPGTDHSAVATQARVEDNLKKAGIENPRQEFGRDGLLEQIREYAEESKATILGQVRKMGTSADWSRLAYTFDEERSAIVNQVFKKMYDDGLIYRGYRVVNWSVVGQSTASDDEVQHEERTTTLYTFKYSADFPIPIATVLPETKLGDSAVAVHPDDERYAQYIGQEFTVDVGAATPLKITVIADDSIDPEYGTGALGVTPAHSTIDFEMYQKNPEIGLIQVVGADGCMTTEAGEAYAGLTTDAAREKFVAWLREEGLMISEEEITHNISVSDRFKDPIWPIPMEQWFVNVNKEIPGKGKTLKQLMKDAVTTGVGGDPEKTVRILPERFDTVYNNWIDNLHDWCISRQIWWGHRIPVWYREGEVYCGETAPDGEGWTQDEDTLDTWFSSGMWTFSALGGTQSDDFKTYHPTAWMQMGYEILPLWMARMILFSTYMVDDIPFKDVYIHGILRAKDGRKFSKSLGNGIDPLDVIEQYGTDALRYSLLKGISPGNDARFYEEKVEHYRNFMNKLWNIARFVDGQEVTGEGSVADQWILSRLNRLVQDVTNDLETYAFSQATDRLYDFVWHEFADWYIEMSKIDGVGGTAGRQVLETVLKLMHPIAPFITEAISHEIRMVTDGDFLMVADWPQANESAVNEAVEQVMDRLKELVVGIRNVRSQYRIDPGKRLAAVAPDLSAEQAAIVGQLARVDIADAEYTTSATVAAGSLSVIIPLDGVVDIATELKRLDSEIAESEQYAAGLEKKLANKNYVDKAPAEVVEETKQRLEETTQQITHLKQAKEGLQ